MRFIFSPMGSDGDVHPFIGLGLELRRRGHEIHFLINGFFADLMQRHGFPFEEVGSRDDYLAIVASPELWSPFRAFPFLFRNAIQPSMRPQYEVFAQHFRSRGAIGVSNCLGLGALLAQDKLGMPLVTVHLQPAVILSRLAPPHFPGARGPRWFRSAGLALGERWILNPVVLPSLNALRGELELPPLRRFVDWWHSRTLVACLFPDWFAPAQADWPANLVQTGFPLWDSSPASHLPDEVETLLADGEPPVVWTPGSANIHAKQFFEVAAEVSRRLGRRAILLTRFQEQIPPSLPPGVVHFDYVPLSKLLPRAAAVVHHGGIGTASQSLAAGIPQLVMTMAHDQFDNAFRLTRLGVGIGIPTPRFSVGRVRRALGELLSSPQVAAACGELARRCAARDGLALAADAIERRFAGQTSS